MKQYLNVVQDQSGRAIQGASVAVTAYPSGDAVIIYSDNGNTPISGSTVLTDATGAFSFWAPSAAYIVTITYKNKVLSTLSPVVISDLNTPTLASLRTISGAYMNQCVLLQNHSSVGDQGGGLFTWDALAISGDNGGTVITPTGVITGRWIRKYDHIILAEWFGAKGDGVTDDTAALQAALNSISTGGKLMLGAKQYICASALTAGYNLCIEGANSSNIGTPNLNSAELLYTGTGTFISAQNITLKNITITGPMDGTNIFTAGTTGISSAGNIRFEELTVQNWDTGWTRTGAFYNKIFGGQFQSCNVCIVGNDIYNLSLFGTRFEECNVCLSYDGGSGPIFFSGCSFENFTTFIVSALSGALGQQIVLSGCYVENSPTTVVAPGLTSKDSVNHTYNLAYGIGINSASICITGCNIDVSGIDRWIYSGIANAGNVICVGNIYHMTDASFLPNYIIYGNFNSIISFDQFDSGLSGVNLVAQIPASFITNGLNNVLSIPPPAQTNITLINGFSNSDANTVPAYYFKDALGIVHLGGAVSGVSSTSIVLGTLPIGYRPKNATYSYFVFYENNTATIGYGRIESDGSIIIDTSTRTSDSRISLEGISFLAA